MLKKVQIAITSLFNRCLNEDHTNSRLIYLLTGSVSALSILILVIAFIHATPQDKAAYPEMVLAVAGTHGAASWGRYMTKKNQGKKDPGTDPQPADVPNNTSQDIDDEQENDSTKK